MPRPFHVESRWHDPELHGQDAAWGLAVQESNNILIYGEHTLQNKVWLIGREFR